MLSFLWIRSSYCIDDGYTIVQSSYKCFLAKGHRNITCNINFVT